MEETAAERFQRYYEEAGPDYASWSPSFNMHFGFWRAGISPFNREAMLEQMNLEVLRRLRVQDHAEDHVEDQTSDSDHARIPVRIPLRIIDLGCGLGATLRTFARHLPSAHLEGISLVPWQIEQGRRLNHASPQAARIRLTLGNYEQTHLPSRSFDAACAFESGCYSHGASKSAFLQEAHRILRPGGRLVVADGFIGPGKFRGPQRALYRKLCDCWVIDTLGEISAFKNELERIGFGDIVVEPMQARVTPSVLHVPVVTLKFLLKEVVFGKRKMSQARWNNILAPILLPFVGFPIGPLAYYIVSATRV
jgi:ubiquinone/menaquinone biosynthesis C-methylase UbiE